MSVESFALIEIHYCVQLVHGDCCVIVRHWTNRCSETGEFDLCDRELDDLWQQPISFTGDGWMNLLKNIADHSETAVKIGISEEHVGHIIDTLVYWKICAHWVPCMLTEDFWKLKD